MNRYLCVFTKKKTTDNSKVILSWKSTRKTEHYHWWPMTETSPDGCHDPMNNLYAKGGGLEKYDNLLGTSSIRYQRAEHFRPHNSDNPDAGWAGFCDLATTLSCLYEYPKHDIGVQVRNTVCVFKKKDIEALMIIACQNSIHRWNSKYYGERNDEIRGDDREEPYPSQLLEILNDICKTDAPFAMDIACGASVWNYGFDSVRVCVEPTCSKLRLMCRPNSIPPETGKTIFYHFLIDSSGFPAKKQDIWGWVNITDGVKTEGWISKWHPDFLWRKFPKDKWDGDCVINPEIEASIVYKMYKHSINDVGKDNILVLR